MQGADAMPNFGECGDRWEPWHGKCREQMLCQLFWIIWIIWNVGMVSEWDALEPWHGF